MGAEKCHHLVGRAWLSHWWIHSTYTCLHKACTLSNQPKSPKRWSRRPAHLTHCPVTRVEKQNFLGIFITLILQGELSCSGRTVTGFRVIVKSVPWNQAVLQTGPWDTFSSTAKRLCVPLIISQTAIIQYWGRRGNGNPYTLDLRKGDKIITNQFWMKPALGSPSHS